MKTGPIVLVEDDFDDKKFFEVALTDLKVPNKLLWFDNCHEALDYLKTTEEKPFLIFSDINLPLQTGIEFKRDIDADPELRKKSIPFIFYSTSVNQQAVNDAYLKITVQGYFEKPDQYKGVVNTLNVIIDYWKVCIHPNSK